MIRLVALACGLLCGAGIVISGLFDPALLQDFMLPQSDWSASLALGLSVAILVIGLVRVLSGNRDAPLLGGKMHVTFGATGWKPLAGGLLFGLGWGLAGYFPLTAMVAAGAFSPGAPIFLASVLAGMIVSDLLTAGRKPTGGRRISRG